MVTHPTLFEAARAESETYQLIGSADLQPKWNIPQKIAIGVAVAKRFEPGAHAGESTMTIPEYVDAASEVIEAGACTVHIDFSFVTDAQGRRLDRDVPSAESYAMVLEPLRARHGMDFIADLNVLNGKSFEECLSPATQGLAEIAPCASGHPTSFVIPAAEILEKNGVRMQIGVHSTGEVELAKRRLIDSGLVKPPYHFGILFGLPFDTGRSLLSGVALYDTEDTARHLFAIVEQIRKIDADSSIIVCAAGRATLYLTTLATMMGLNIRVGTEDTPWKYPNSDERLLAISRCSPWPRRLRRSTAARRPPRMNIARCSGWLRVEHVRVCSNGRTRRLSKVIISCAVTGSVHTPSMSEHLPITPDQIAQQSVEAAEAGAAVLHLHARDPASGKPTADPNIFMEFLPRIKQATDAVVNITTGGGQNMSFDDRLAAAERASPELCSLNMGSMNFGLYPMVPKYDFAQEWERDYLEGSRNWIFRNTFGDIELILDRLGNGHGTRFEFECYDTGHLYTLAHFLDRKLVKPPLFVQSIFGILGGQGADTENLIHSKRLADKLFGDQYVWSVMAAGRHQMPFITMGAINGGNVRVGLEDSLYAGKGRLASSNAEQVRLIRSILEPLSLQIATPVEARQILDLKGADNVAF